jgi:uncharacterized protein (TIGR02466 family)
LTDLVTPFNQVLLFPTVIHEHDLSAHADLAVLRELSDQMSFDKIRLIPNSTYRGRQAGGILDHPALVNLRTVLESAVQHWAATVGCRPIYINHSWLNRYTRGDRVERHRHEMSIVSATLFVHADPNSCALTFHSPIEQLRMFEQSQGSTTFYNENYRDFVARTGHLVIFPSWLQHDTLNNQSDLRITLSFNTTYASG